MQLVVVGDGLCVLAVAREGLEAEIGEGAQSTRMQPGTRRIDFARSRTYVQADRGSEAWKKAVAIASIARQKLAGNLPSSVLWYHATYVSPKWGKRLTKQTQIGLHIFYS